MRSLVLAVVGLLLLAGCISKDTPDELPAAELESNELPPETTPSPSDPAKAPAPASPTPGASSAPAAGSPPPANATPSTIEPTPVTVTTAAWEGSITAAGAYVGEAVPVRACCQVVEASGENTVMTFEVPAGLTALVVELAWTQGQAPADLDLVVEAPDVADAETPAAGPGGVDTRTGHWWVAAAGSPADTTATASLLITEPEALALAGTWTWRVLPKGPANGVAFHVVVSQFTGTLPEEGYSALATPSGNP